MTTPALIYSLLVATLLGSIFHFWKGGGGKKLWLSLFLSWVGFYLGHILGASWDLEFLMIGPVYAGIGVMGSIFLLLLGNFFSQLDES